MISSKPRYLYLPLITAIYVTCTLISFTLAYKMVPVGFAIIPAGVLVFPIIYTLSDVVTEIYGYQRARRMLWEGAFCGLFFITIVTLLLHLPSPHAKLFDMTLGKIWRIYFGVIIGVTVGAFVNIYLMSKWKIYAKGRYFWFRSFISTSLGDAAITIIVDSIAFIGVMSFHKLMTVVISIYLFKVIYAFFAAIPASYFVSFLKHAEKMDTYDNHINFNPFSLKVGTETEKE